MSHTKQDLEALFEAASAIKNAEERASYLIRACPDPGMRREVESLLEAEANPDSLFAGETVQEGMVSVDEEAGAVIGRYKLLELLGEGGFGSVWLAEQKEPVRRKVALKVIKLGMDTRQVVARFEAERQALAMMDHPNIAKILDAGMTLGAPTSRRPLSGDGKKVEEHAGETPALPAGRPYFVMELVRGIPITKFCEENGMELRERVELFVKVCHAIQHAHQKGIIHRDIKPTNVLVTLHDGVPVPKVIDFGIAKATQGELTEKTIHTQFQQFIGTPAYVSPEQAEMSGLDVDTRTDIYSLGVLMYELLTGSTPFDGRELMASGIDAMRRTIREKEPERPSTRLKMTGQGKAGGKGLPPGMTLTSDLDWIVMKCLEKDRTRRYETANGLASDIRRYLANEPVVARPPSTGYKVGKFVRRNKVMVVAGSAVVIALLVGLGSSLMLVSRLQKVLAEKDGILKAKQESDVARVVEEAMFSAMSGDSAKMDRALQQADANRISSGKILMLQGLHSLVSGAPDKAVGFLREAERLEPSSVAVKSLLASAYSADGKWFVYEKILSELGRLTPVTAEDFLFQGEMLAADDSERGLPLLDESIRRRRSPLALSIRANARCIQAFHTFKVSDIRAALDDAAAARSWSSDNLGVLLSSIVTHGAAVVIYRAAGDEAEALRQSREGDLIDSKLEAFGLNPMALDRRFHRLEMEGREEESFERLRRWVEKDGVRNTTIVARYASGLLRRGNSTRALELLDEVRGVDDFADSMRVLAMMGVPGRRHQVREAYYELRKTFDSSGIQLFSPFLLWYAGYGEEARTLGRKYLQNPPAGFDQKREFYHRMAKYMGEELSRKAMLASVQNSRPELMDVSLLVAVQELAEGNRSEAIKHLRTVVEVPLPYWFSFDFARVILAQLERDPDIGRMRGQAPERRQESTPSGR